MPVKYLTDHHSDVQFIKKPVKTIGILAYRRGQNQDGYGTKISTDYMAIINNRRHRIYLIQVSNIGSMYVLVKNERLFVRNYDIPEEVQRG